MTAGPAVAAALALAVLVWPPEHRLLSRRARLLWPPARPPRPAAGRRPVPRLPGRRWRSPGRGLPAGSGRRWLLAVASGGAVGVLVGGPSGLVAAVLLAVAVERLLRRRPARRERDADEIVRDLPIACDLLAACLSAGVPLSPALAGVATALGGPLGAGLGTVAGLLRLGAEPRTAWAEAPAEVAALARLLTRTAENGAAVSGPLRALAADTRAIARSRAEADVRRAGVWVLAPLGACFLPAFLCLGVIPLVLGIAADVFG